MHEWKKGDTFIITGTDAQLKAISAKLIYPRKLEARANRSVLVVTRITPDNEIMTDRYADGTLLPGAWRFTKEMISEVRKRVLVILKQEA